MKRLVVTQRGDTLVEVIFALVILSVILVTTISLARLSQVQSGNDLSRTQASNFLQQQYEALREYRDGHSWDQFVQQGLGMRFLQHTDRSSGVNTLDCEPDGAAVGSGATPGALCFHMERDANPADGANYGKWVPCPGPLSPSSYYDTTWNLSASMLDSNFSGGPNPYFTVFGCTGDLSPKVRPTITGMSVWIEVNPKALGSAYLSRAPATSLFTGTFSPDCSQQDYYPLKFKATWPENGQLGARTTESNLTTIIGNINTRIVNGTAHTSGC